MQPLRDSPGRDARHVRPYQGYRYNITYPRASTVAQSLTLTESLREISVRQELARINAFFINSYGRTLALRSTFPPALTPDGASERRSASAKI